MDSTAIVIIKYKKIPSHKTIQEMRDTMKRLNILILGITEGEETQAKSEDMFSIKQ